MAGLDRGARLQVGIVVAAGVDGGDVDVRMLLVELLDQPLHLECQLALYRDGKEQVDVGGCIGGGA